MYRYRIILKLSPRYLLSFLNSILIAMDELYRGIKKPKYFTLQYLVVFR